MAGIEVYQGDLESATVGLAKISDGLAGQVKAFTQRIAGTSPWAGDETCGIAAGAYTQITEAALNVLAALAVQLDETSHGVRTMAATHEHAQAATTHSVQRIEV